MVTIIPPSTNENNWKYFGRCRKCGCTFIVDREDITDLPDKGGYSYAQITDCPAEGCNSAVKVRPTLYSIKKMVI